MYKIDAEEKARAKYQVDRLAPLGGFIEEEAEDKMMRLYPQKIIALLKKYCRSGQEILLAAERLESIKNEIADRNSDDAEMLYRTLSYEDDFSEWFLRKNAEAEAESLQKEEAGEKEYPALLSALERQILCLYVEKNMELAQLAEEMECKENDEYIVLILHYMKRKLKRGECEIKELEARLAAEKLELDW